MEQPTLIHFTTAPDAHGPLFVGRTFDAVIVIRGTDGLPVELSGYNVACQARLDSEDLAPAFTLAATIVDVTEDGTTYPSGGVRLFLGATAAAVIERGLYWYDVKLTSKTDADIVISPAAGNMQVEGTGTH